MSIRWHVSILDPSLDLSLKCQDVATIRQVQMKAQQVEALQQIFREIDRDNENEVRFEDVRNAMMSGELASFMESLGISTDDVRSEMI